MVVVVVVCAEFTSEPGRGRKKSSACSSPFTLEEPSFTFAACKAQLSHGLEFDDIQRGFSFSNEVAARFFKVSCSALRIGLSASIVDLCAFLRRLLSTPLSILVAVTCIALLPYLRILLSISMHLSIVLAASRVGLLLLPWGLQSTVQRILLARMLFVRYFALFGVQVMP